MKDNLVLEPKKINVSLNIDGYPFTILVDGYYHKELDEDIIYADESRRVDEEIERFKLIIRGWRESTKYILSENFLSQNTALPLIAVVST